MTRLIYLVLLLSLFVGGCRRSPSAPDAGDEPNKAADSGVVTDEGCPHKDGGSCGEAPSAASADTKKQGTELYGAPLGTSPQVSLSELLKSPQEFNDKTIRVAGHVKRACSRKGCWMELAVDDSSTAPSCRVTFLNYGFLVPTTSAGSQALVEAKVQLTRVKKEAVDHYESEGASFRNKDEDGSAQEVRLVATGVELNRR